MCHREGPQSCLSDAPVLILYVLIKSLLLLVRRYVGVTVTYTYAYLLTNLHLQRQRAERQRSKEIETGTDTDTDRQIMIDSKLVLNVF